MKWNSFFLVLLGNIVLITSIVVLVMALTPHIDAEATAKETSSPEIQTLQKQIKIIEKEQARQVVIIKEIIDLENQRSALDGKRLKAIEDLQYDDLKQFQDLLKILNKEQVDMDRRLSAILKIIEIHHPIKR